MERIKVKSYIFQSNNNPRDPTDVKREHTAPVVAAEIRYDVFVLALLHHGNLLLDGRNVVTWQTDSSDRLYSQQ